MKKLIMAIVLSAMFARAEYGLNCENLVYSYPDDTGHTSVIGYMGTPIDVTVPSSVLLEYPVYEYDEAGGTNVVTTIRQNCQVDKVGYLAFFQCHSIKSVVISDGVQQIGGSAFVGCDSLERITIPPSITRIERAAFFCDKLSRIDISDLEAWCNLDDQYSGFLSNSFDLFINGVIVKKLVIPEGVEAIQSDRFAHCVSIESVEIPNTVKKVGLFLCPNLQSFVVAPGNSYFSSVDGVLFNGDGSVLIQYPPGKTDDYYPIPDSVETIGDGAFMGCINLHDVWFPNSVRYIGNEAFSGCSMYNISVLADVGCGAFRGSSLGSVFIGGAIADYAFEHCFIFGPVSLCGNYIGSHAFADVRTAWDGPCEFIVPMDPSYYHHVDEEAFPSESIGWYSHYYEAEWLQNIDSTGCWHGLKMQPDWFTITYYANGGEGWMDTDFPQHDSYVRLSKSTFFRTGHVFQGWATSMEEANGGNVVYTDGQYIYIDSDISLFAVWDNPALTLTAESADWLSESITLRCEDADTSGATHTYNLEYLDENNAWVAVGGAGAANVAAAADGFAHLTDGGFCSRLDGIKTVSYRVKDENGRVSEPCVTRNRYGLSVGFNKYGTKAKPLDQSLADARLFQNLALSKGRFSRVELLKNGDATTGGIHDAFVRWADVVKPGDAFAFFIATHGGFNGSRAGLSAYNGLYPVSSLVDDSSLLPVGSLFVGVVMSCHSRAMVDYSDTDHTKFQYQVRNGLAQCRVNSAWISSCGYDESSYNSPSSSQSAFGEWFLEKGWQGGFADAILNGLDYGGGNGNGKLTLLEVAKYTHAFYKGNSDSKPSEVYWDTANNDLLGAFVLDASCRPQSMTAPSMPTGVTASQGDTKIGISWTASGNATSYRIYRYPLDSPGEFKWIGISGGSRFPDDTATLKKEYGYRIKAVNPVGMSDFSSAAIGSRGTSKFIEFLDSFFGITTASAEEYDTMEKTLAANGCRTVGECYALGIDPEDPNDDFRIEGFEIRDGKPVITLNHTEDGSGNSFVPCIRTLGAKELGAAAQWDDVTDIADTAAEGYRFFKVNVELP